MIFGTDERTPCAHPELEHRTTSASSTSYLPKADGRTGMELRGWRRKAPTRFGQSVSTGIELNSVKVVDGSKRLVTRRAPGKAASIASTTRSAPPRCVM